MYRSQMDYIHMIHHKFNMGTYGKLKKISYRSATSEPFDIKLG